MADLRSKGFPENTVIVCKNKEELKVIVTILYHYDLMVRGDLEDTITHWDKFRRITSTERTVCLYPFSDSFSAFTPSNRKYTIYTAVSFIDMYNGYDIPTILDKLDNILNNGGKDA